MNGTGGIPLSSIKGQEINFEFLERSQQLFLSKIDSNPKLRKANIDEIILEALEYLKHLN